MAYGVPLQTIKQLLLVANDVFDSVEGNVTLDTEVNLAHTAASHIPTVLCKLTVFVISATEITV